MRKFNFMWGVIGFVLGSIMMNIGMGVAFAFVFGMLLFPKEED